MLTAELSAIEAKIAKLRVALKVEAKIIGATCTKTYLSQKDIGKFDLVIIDEASMVMTPVAWFLAGLARQQVVISGDFRQLPPIVPTEKQAIFDSLGQDPFTATKRNEPDHPELAMLSKQYRMRSEICDLIAKPMYQGRLSTAPDLVTKFSSFAAVGHSKRPLLLLTPRSFGHSRIRMHSGRAST